MQPFVHRVFHPTDFSEASQRAFAHALAIAVTRQATLTIMNASQGFEGDDWTRFPSVRKTLEQWGLLERGSDRADVFEKLRVKVKKVGVDADDPVDAILDYLAGNPADLMVLATEGREGLPGFLHGSVAQKVARVAGVRTLFVPAAGTGFVSPERGELSLSRILVPVAETPDPQAAVDTAARAAAGLGAPPIAIQVMHVGKQMPAVTLPDDEFEWSRSTRQGEVIDEILAAARELPADLLVMTTDGRDAFIDVFRGSHAERVVRGAPCPVAAIPIPKA